MSYATVYGVITTRNYATRLTINEICCLKDNASLEEVLGWFKQNGVRRPSDIPSSKAIQTCNDVEFASGITWLVDDKFWSIQFFNSQRSPMDFQSVIPRYFELFQKLINMPFKRENEEVLKELEQLKTEINRLIEELKETI